MNLIWIVSGPLERRNGRLFSALGSHRLRCLEPAAALARRGHRVGLLQAEKLVDLALSPDWRAADAVIVAKQFTNLAPQLRTVKSHGPRIVIDLCDDVLGLEHLRNVYAPLLELADACTAASSALAEHIRGKCGLPVAVVPDCVEGEARPPIFSPNCSAKSGQPLRLLWFGQPNNIESLDAALGELGRRFPGAALDIVTRLSPAISARFPDGRDALSIRHHPWSPDTMDKALHACDLVLLPSIPSDSTHVKSSNRLTTALWAGRLAVAFPLPSYRPFADCAVLSETMADGVAQALAMPVEMQARLARGQRLIADRFIPAAVAEAWELALSRCCPARSLTTLSKMDDCP